jgi:FAD/FMN-containing dehydrogenase
MMVQPTEGDVRETAASSTTQEHAQEHQSLDDAAAGELAAALRGELLRPGDGAYESARQVWNGMIDRRPAAIARCAGVADVVAAVQFARAHDIQVAVRGAGHNVAGKAVCDGGLVIDLSHMRGVRVDPVARSAQAQAGVTWGEFDRETQHFGLATTGGAVSTTGISGLTLGGGVGWLMGKLGATCDNVLAVDVVTADGAFLTASERQHADLFWGLRGGGGNFGIATSFHYRLHAVGPIVLGGMALYPFARAREVLRLYRDLTATAPDELTAYAGFVTPPGGELMVAVPVCYCGAPADGVALIAPLRSFGPPAADLLGPIPYVAQQTLFDAGLPYGQHSYWKSGGLRDLSDAAIDTIVDQAAHVTSPASIVLVEHHHGAVNRVAPEATAFAQREAPYDLVIISLWTDPTESERHIRWTREFWAAMAPFAAGGVYVNTLAQDEPAERVRAAYGPNFARLAALKRRYDPDNFFRLNQNIPPTGA